LGLPLQVLIPETEPVIARLRVGEIDDDEGRRLRGRVPHDSLAERGNHMTSGVIPACATQHSGQRLLRMEITQLSPKMLTLPVGGNTVSIARQLWALEPWEGDDNEPELPDYWASKDMFSVNGSQSCAELAVLHHLRGSGWYGVWVSPWGPGALFSEWPPGLGVKSITQAGAPLWAAEIFDRLLKKNGQPFSGFWDVFVWREPGEVRFYEVKVGKKDKLNHNQHKFVERALGLDHRLEEFMIIEVPKPKARVLHRKRASDVHIQTTQPGDEARQDPDETTADVLARMKASQNASPYLGPAAEALQALGYELRPSNLRKPGTKPRENHLRIMHPAYTAHGIGFLKLSDVTFTRRSDRGPLGGLSGAKLTDRGVIFSIANGIDGALSAAKLIARLITASGA
jgi:hypothetical protein